MPIEHLVELLGLTVQEVVHDDKVRTAAAAGVVDRFGAQLHLHLGNGELFRLGDEAHKREAVFEGLGIFLGNDAAAVGVEGQRGLVAKVNIDQHSAKARHGGLFMASGHGELRYKFVVAARHREKAKGGEGLEVLGGPGADGIKQVVLGAVFGVGVADAELVALGAEVEAAVHSRGEEVARHVEGHYGCVPVHLAVTLRGGRRPVPVVFSAQQVAEDLEAVLQAVSVGRCGAHHGDGDEGTMLLAEAGGMDGGCGGLEGGEEEEGDVRGSKFHGVRDCGSIG